jgi:uncharacterized protein YbgA (DUF1722 family)
LAFLYVEFQLWHRAVGLFRVLDGHMQRPLSPLAEKVRTRYSLAESLAQVERYRPALEVVTEFLTGPLGPEIGTEERQMLTELVSKYRSTLGLSLNPSETDR